MEANTQPDADAYYGDDAADSGDIDMSFLDDETKQPTTVISNTSNVILNLFQDPYAMHYSLALKDFKTNIQAPIHPNTPDATTNVPIVILNQIQDPYVMKDYYVYILASKARGTLYIGISNSLERRTFEHATSPNTASFTQKYSVKRLVYYEQCNDAELAIAREKQLKNWHRQWKINLVEADNPNWDDLAVRHGIDTETSSV